MTRSTVTLAAALLLLATWTAPAAAGDCETTGSWRNVETADVVLTARAAAATSGWTKLDMNGGGDMFTLTEDYKTVGKLNVRFNGSDNGQRNELTVTFRPPGVNPQIQSYTMVVQARKRKPEGVLIREIKVKGFDTTGVKCVQNVNPFKKTIQYDFLLGE